MSEKNNWVIITGASKGIGKAIAYELATRKFDLVLVARSADLLDSISKDLIEKFKIETRVFAADISDPTEQARLLQFIQTEKLDLRGFINNAGIGLMKYFLTPPVDRWLDIIRLNVETTMRLTHLFLPELKKHPSAFLLNVSSCASFQPIPGMAIYAASKAFVTSFTRSLRFELKNTNIKVSCLCPGGVLTDFARIAQNEDVVKKNMLFNMTAEKAARITVKKMLRGKAEIIPGWYNGLAYYLVKFFPMAWATRSSGRIFRERN